MLNHSVFEGPDMLRIVSDSYEVVNNQTFFLIGFWMDIFIKELVSIMNANKISDQSGRIFNDFYVRKALLNATFNIVGFSQIYQGTLAIFDLYFKSLIIKWVSFRWWSRINAAHLLKRTVRTKKYQIQNIKIQKHSQQQKLSIIQMSCQFKVKYTIQSLQTKNNPLFTHIQAYLISDNITRLVSEAKQLTNNHAYFESTIEENAKILNYNSTTGKYKEVKVKLVFQFQAQEKFIKLGETIIDLSDIVNNNKSGQLLSYRLEKCYDRNAKVWLTVDINSIQHRRLNKNTEMRDKKQNMHIKSHNDLPQVKPRGKSVYQRNNYTECSVVQNQNFVFKEDLSLKSQKKTNYNPNKIQFERYTTGKTQVLKKTFQNKEEFEILQEDLTLANTNLKLIQNQLSAVEQKYLQVSKKLQETDHKLKVTQKQKSKLQETCQQLQFKLSVLQKNNTSTQKQQQNQQAQKYLRMFHQSDNLRNKLLLEIENQRKQVREKMKLVQERAATILKKTKSVQKQEQMLKEDLKCCMLQISNLQHQLNSQKNLRLNKEEQIGNNLLQINRLQKQLTLRQSELGNINKQQSQLAQELQISKLTINELEHEKNELKIMAEKRLERIQYYEAQIAKSNQTLKLERLKYSRNLQEMQQYTERQQKHFEKYIEQLQTKTINDYNKNNENTQLKRDITKLNKWLSEERERNNNIYSQIQQLREEHHSLERKMTKEQNQNMLLQKQKGILQRELIKLREVHEQVSYQINNEEQQMIQIQTEEIIERSYVERDQFWKKQIEKVEYDTRLLIEKHKKQKQALLSKSKTLQKQLNQQKKEFQNYKMKISHLEETVAKKQRQFKEQTLKITQLQETIRVNESKIALKQSKIAQLQIKNHRIQQLQDSLVENQKKISLKTKQTLNIKAELEKQRQLKNKYRMQVKEAFAAISNVITKSQRQQIFYSQLRYDNLEPQSLMLLNTTLKIFTDKHNRIRLKLQKAEQLKNEIDQKEKKLQQNNNVPKFQRKLSTSSKNLNNSFRQEEDIFISSKLNDSRTTRFMQKKEQKEVVSNLLRQELTEVKSRLEKQKQRNLQLQKEISRLQQNAEDQRKQLIKTKQLLESKSQEYDLEVFNGLKKQKNIAIAKEEIQSLMFQLENTKNQLQIFKKMQKQQKIQPFWKKSNSIIVQPKTQDDSFFKVIELQRKLRQNQQELQKLKKQKEDRRKEDGPQNKQLKILQFKLKQHEATISNLKKQLDQERKNKDKQKELFNARVKKMKQNFEEEVQNHIKQKKQLKQNIETQEQKLKQLTRKNKILEENLKKTKSQLSNFAEKEEKNMKTIISQWELKIKSLKNQHQNELSILKRQMEDQKTLQKSLKQVINKKQKEMKQLKEEIDKKIKDIQNLNGQCQIYGIRIKSLEQEQYIYKQTIGVLQKKIYESSESSKKNTDKQHQRNELKSNYSQKTFTFR